MKKILFSLLVLMFCLTFIQNVFLAQGFAIPSVQKDEVSNREFSSGDSTDSSGVKVDEDLSSLLSGLSSSSSSSSASLTSSVARVVVAYFSSRYFPVGDDKEKGFSTARAEAVESLSTAEDSSTADEEDEDEKMKIKSVSRPTLNPQAPNDFRDFLLLRNLTATTPPLAWTDQNNEQAQNKEKEKEEREEEEEEEEEEGAGDGDFILVVQVQSFYTSENNNDENNENNRENSLVGLSKDAEIDTTTIPPSTTTIPPSTTTMPPSTTTTYMTPSNTTARPTNGTTTLRPDLQDMANETTEWSLMNTTTESSYGANKTNGLSTMRIFRKMFDPRKMDVMYFFGGVASMLAVVGALLLTRKLLYRPVSN